MLDLLERLPIIGAVVTFIKDVFASPYTPPKGTGDYDQREGHKFFFGGWRLR